MAAKPKPRIFCVEGPWSSRLDDRRSVVGLLDHLEASDRIKSIHVRALSVDGAIDALRKWPQVQYRQYNLGYLAFHGAPGELIVGRRHLSLEQLGAQLEGHCRGKVIYFGSCSVLDVRKSRIEAFRRQVGAKCVAGYLAYVDWMESSAFDLLLFDVLCRYQRMDAAERYLKREFGGFARRLEFKMFHGS